jgi:hypothetical protein
MKSFRLRLVSRIDKRGNRYYFCTTKVPLTIDLSNTAIHFYKNTNDEGDLVGELVVRFYEDQPSKPIEKEVDKKEL